MPEVSHTIAIAAPRGVVYRVLTDYAAYPEFLPTMVSAEVRERGPEYVVVAFELQLVVRVRYDLRIVETTDRGVEWSLAEGIPSRVFSVNTGSWALDLTSDATPTTEAHYRLQVALRSAIPARVSEHLVGATLPSTLDRFKQRAEALVAAEASKSGI